MTASPNIVAVASGKGGVGKTWLSVTLAAAATRKGARAVLLDGDIGLANVDIQLGLAPTADLSQWAAGKATLADLAIRAEAGFDVIPGASGSGALAGATGAEVGRLARDFADLAKDYDLGLIDIAAGIEPAQLRFAGAAPRCLLIITQDPTSLTDGYAFIKLAQRLKRPPAFEVVVNMAETRESGAKAYGAIARAAKSFLGLEPPLAGVIRRDAAVNEAIRRQSPIPETAPAARDVEALLAGLLGRQAKAA